MTATALPTTDGVRQRRLIRLMWLAIAAAVATIALKLTAWLLTGSVGLLSDAAESVVNLVAAAFGLIAIHWAGQPADEEHTYGHEKANYLAAGVEGALILIAALTIGVTAIDRLLNPQPIEAVGIGLAVSMVASAVNLAVGLLLIRVGRREHAMVLEADGKHLLTDVWTSVGVVIGVALVAITGWERLDPIVALVVAVNIVVAGSGLVRRSADGLMDRALEPGERQRIDAVLERFTTERTGFHALRTRRAGRRAFVSVHVLVPGEWSVQHAHDFVEQVEAALRDSFAAVTVDTHLEPIEDPVSFADVELDRPRGDRP
jgi:cation diffusion facilitator family transporter